MQLAEIALVAVTISSNLLIATEAATEGSKTWGDIKRCAADDVIASCHEKCKSELPTAAQEPIKACELELTSKIFEETEKCYRANGADVKDTDDCWSGNFTALEAEEKLRPRRDAAALAALQARNAQLKAYSNCFQTCKGNAATIVKDCTKSCSQPSSAQQTAIDLCAKDPKLAKGYAKLFLGFITCAVSATLDL